MGSVPDMAAPSRLPIALSLAVAAPTAVIGGTFGLSHVSAYFCGLHAGKAPMFLSVLAKVEHLERVHHAFVWERPDSEGGGYSYTAQVPAN